MKGLKSPYGRRGAICEHFGWTWDYLHHGIAWSVIQRIMCDLPFFEETNGEVQEVELSDDNATDIMNYINNMM